MAWYDNFVENRFSNFNVLATVDDIGYTEKPKDQETIKSLNNRIGVKADWFNFANFADMVGNKGHTFCPATFECNGKWAPRRKNTFLQQQIFALDFDGGITQEEVLKRALDYKIPPTFIYKTLSSDDIEVDKFRVIWVADFIVSDIVTAEGIIKLLMTIYPDADKACKDCCRMFFGGKGITHMSSNPYLSRLTIINLSSAVECYIKDKYYKDRLDKMRAISEETGIVLKGGHLDIQERALTDEQFAILVKYAKPKEWDNAFRFYVLPKEAGEIFNEEILDEENIIYIAIRKICSVGNIVYFIRMNRDKEVKKKKGTVKIKDPKVIYTTKSNTEYKVNRNSERGITREKLFEKCLMIQDFVNDVYLTFDELFGICTNLTCIEGGLAFFKDVIKDSKHNIARDTDWHRV